jgi:hypothetical protein
MFRRTFLQLAFLCLAAISAQAQLLPASPAPQPQLPPPSDGDPKATTVERVPTNTIIIKGAEPSASDHSTPLPEDGSISKGVYRNRYLGLSFPLPAGWMETFDGPPPSDSGGYVLAQLVPAPSFKGPGKGTMLISAQDMFFSRVPARNAVELINFSKEHLPSYYEVEHAPSEVTIAGQKFVRFDYKSPAADLHWYILATEIRCHAVQFVLTSRDTALLESIIAKLGEMELPPEASAAQGNGGGAVPLCVANYARAENITYKVDPNLADRRFNSIPVRIIIDTKGHVRHVHVVSAFPDQATKITDALLQWTFKPYTRDGQAVEVETGIMFRSSRTDVADPSGRASATND